MRSWPNLFQTSESVSAQFVCLLVWIYFSCQLPLCLGQSSQKQFCFLLETEDVSGSKMESPLSFFFPLPSLVSQERSHTARNLRLSLVLLCCTEVQKLKGFTQTLLPLYTHTYAISKLTYCSQTNTMLYLPRSCSSPPHNQAHAPFLVARCNAERSVELSVINLLQHSL